MSDVSAPVPDPLDPSAAGEEVRFDDVVFVTPWYPTEANPMWGSFVVDAVTTLRRHWTEPVTVIHVDGNPRTPAEGGDPVAEAGAEVPVDQTDAGQVTADADASDLVATEPEAAEPVAGDAVVAEPTVEPLDAATPGQDQGGPASGESGATESAPEAPTGPPESWSWIEELPEARVVRIRVPMDPMTPRHKAIEYQRHALMTHARDHIRRASYLNAHVGAPTGAAVAPLLTPRTRFVITEHATYVRAVFKDMEAATDYRAAVARAQAVIAVGDESAGVLRKLCPQQSEIIRAVPNPVRIDSVPLREQPMRSPDRWLYVGSLIERKGVLRLIESFALAVSRHPDRPLRLTMVGDGPLREQLDEQVAELGLTDRVTFTGIVAPALVGSYMRTHDVLVHLSAYETFGLTIIEAAAAGLPVVVTKCGGPEETMALPADLGLCAFVPRDPSASDVVDAVDSLRTDVEMRELEQSRAVLRNFYGEDRVADLLRKYVLGSAPEEPLAEPGDLRIVVVFQGMMLWRRLMHGIQRAVDMGAEVVAVDLESMTSGVVPAGMTIIGVGDLERHNPFLRLERAVVDRAPRAVLRGAGRVADKLPESRQPQAKQVLARAGTFHARVSGFSQRQVYRRPWLLVRGLVMAKRAERQPEIYAADHIDVIVHGGTRFTQLTYRLLKKHPEAQYHSGAFTAKHVATWWGESLRRKDRVQRGESA